MADLNGLLRHLIEQKGSDLHIKVGSVPHLRVHGRIRRTPFDASTAEEVSEMVADLVPTGRTRDLAERGEVSLAHGVPGLGRFRLNIYRQRGTYGLSVRLVSPGAPAIESLDLPPAVVALADCESGLVVISGPASSGRTTTAAAMLDHVNRARSVHIVTLEDPIEVLLADKSSIISQREVGVDVRSTAEAMRRIGQLDPDVIFISELNDPDTITEAITAAAAGRFVLTTTSATSAAGTVGHLLGHFEAARQPQVRHGLAAVLRGVLSQRLLTAADGAGLVPAVEVLTAAPAVVELIAAGGGVAELSAAMAGGAASGMQTMDQALVRLVNSGKVASSVALAASGDPDGLGEVLRGRADDGSGDEISA